MWNFKFEWDQFLLFDLKVRYRFTNKIDLPIQNILDNTYARIDLSKYQITAKEESFIKFKGIFRSRHSHMSRINEGKIEWSLDDPHELMITYEDSILVDLLIASAYIIISFFVSFSLLFFSLIFLVQMIVRIGLLQNAAKEMISVNLA